MRIHTGDKLHTRGTCDLQQCGILTSVDKPVQPPFNLRNTNLCSVSSLTLIEYLND